MEHDFLTPCFVLLKRKCVRRERPLAMRLFAFVGADPIALRAINGELTYGAAYFRNPGLTLLAPGRGYLIDLVVTAAMPDQLFGL